MPMPARQPENLSPSGVVSVPPMPTHTNMYEAQTIIRGLASGNRIPQKFGAQWPRADSGQVQR